MKYTGKRYLEATEDIDIYLKTFDEVKALVVDGRIRQGQMLAPLWKFFYEFECGLLNI